MDGGQPTSTTGHSESLETLTGHARGRFGRISPERIARHVMQSVPEGDWTLLRAALDALVRRYGFARRDGLALVSRPKRGTALGSFRTRGASADGRRDRARPYDTQVLSVSPLRTSCSCRDFLRSGLGLCKHGLVVLEALEVSGALAADSKRQRAASTESAQSLPRSTSQLSWNPILPLLGPYDRLQNLRLQLGHRRRELPGWPNGRPNLRELRSPERRLLALRELDRLMMRGSVDIEPAALALLSEERARAEQAARAAAAVPALMKSLKTLRRKLYPYQREGVRRFFEAGRLLLADDMGLGKTTQAIAACHGLLETRTIQRGLLIVPASLKAQWKREWEASTRQPLEIVDGSPQERAQHYAQMRRGVLIIGYEQLLRDFEHVLSYAPELVVLDEAQRIKNWMTKSAVYVKALAPRYRLVLTGTPMENRFDELASIMDFVDDLALEPKWRLTPLHGLSESDGGRGSHGAKHLGVLRERLAPVVVRRVRQEVLSQLPPRSDTRVPVELTEPQREAHEGLRAPIAQLMTIAARRPLRQPEFLRLMQLLTTQRMICNGLAQVEFESVWPRHRNQPASSSVLQGLFSPKLATLRGLVEQIVLDQGRKAVVFSQWRKMLRLSEWAVRDLLESAGKRAVFFTGAESPKQRERAIVELHDDPDVAVMFLSDAGGVGLNLQRAANCCINLELPWNPAVLEQRIGRIYRLGQSSPVDVYNLVSEEGIEGRIAELVQRKRAVFSGLFDATTEEVRFDGQHSFLESVKTLVDMVPVAPTASFDSDAEVGVDVEDSASAPLEMLDDAAPSPPAPELAPKPAPGTSQSQGMSIEQLGDGSLKITAPPALAAPLAQLLQQLADGLRDSAAQRG